LLAHPASIDNVPTDGGKEDHVSMGMTAAIKLRSIIDLAENDHGDRIDYRGGRIGIPRAFADRARVRRAMKSSGAMWRG
jgi:hypothetical protein